MNVKAIKSVGAKLFFYMSLLVLLTILGNSWQFGRTFIAFQKEQVQNAILQQAEAAGNRIDNEIERFKAQIATALPSFRSLGGNETDAQIQRFLAANTELISLLLVEAPSANSTDLKTLGRAFSSHDNDQRFGDKAPAKINDIVRDESLKFIKKIAPKNKKRSLSIDSLAKQTGLPLLLVAARFEVSDAKSVVWAVLCAWQSNILKSIPGSPDMEIAIIDDDGRVFSSVKEADMMERRAFDGGPLVKSALRGSSPSGFQDEYKISGGRRRLGAFFRMPQYEISVVVQKDAEQAYTVLKRSMFSTMLWASLFILVAVMFAYIGAQGITRGLREVTYATNRIAAGDFKYRIQLKSEDEVGALGHSINVMSSKIIDLLSNQVEKARFEKELETARMVQGTFFPKADINTGTLGVTGYYQPASECGGDLWGHFQIAKGVDLVFIADAMGHGAPAALVTAMAYATTMTVADIVKTSTSFDSPAELLGRINRIIYNAVGGQISMTFFVTLIDQNRGTMIYANAGHNFPLLMPLKADDERRGKKKKDAMPISLTLKGTPLGVDPNASFQEKSMPIAAGDKIFFFTDGLIECTSPEGRAWGRKYLVESLQTLQAKPGEAVKNDVVAKAFAFFGKNPIADDVTVVVAEISKDWQAQPQVMEAAITHTSARRAPPKDLIEAPPAPSSPAAGGAVALEDAPELPAEIVVPSWQTATAVDPSPAVTLPSPAAPIASVPVVAQAAPQPSPFSLSLALDDGPGEIAASTPQAQPVTAPSTMPALESMGMPELGLSVADPLPGLGSLSVSLPGVQVGAKTQAMPPPPPPVGARNVASKGAPPPPPPPAGRSVAAPATLPSAGSTPLQKTTLPAQPSTPVIKAPPPPAVMGVKGPTSVPAPSGVATPLPQPAPKVQVVPPPPPKGPGPAPRSQSANGAVPAPPTGDPNRRFKIRLPS